MLLVFSFHSQPPPKKLTPCLSSQSSVYLPICSLTPAHLESPPHPGVARKPELQRWVSPQQSQSPRAKPGKDPGDDKTAEVDCVKGRCAGRGAGEQRAPNKKAPERRRCLSQGSTSAVWVPGRKGSRCWETNVFNVQRPPGGRKQGTPGLW